MGIESRRQLEELYLPPSDRFVTVDVPHIQYAMIDGAGSPDGPAFELAMRWLVAAVYPIRKIAKARMGRRFVEPPVEGLWWADDMADLVAGHKDRLKWRLLMPTADWVTREMFAEATAEAARRLGEVLTSLRLENYAEGQSVQFMHVGPPAGAQPTLTRLHHEFLPASGLVARGPHHEIYLSDPRRTAPDRMKTVFRQPVSAA